ncbi:DUF423 domain-containing protein [Gramella jeungdoensis]|uniref:DUF423 domain-containing protein n=1 Tax=Gramella jeungdoensis TaxID=708091 RepID=A0ABT0YZ03_9FLAO|nr:DUF423 domain-containing protein [Gramella jeungdoensis]MCM8568702.1 DUF423 domain-containing protein [Gramella jeungdoensis]
MNRRFLIAGALFGLLAVILGAFAVHGLKDIISENSLNSFETGVRFQIYHALLLLIIGGFGKAWNLKFTWIFYLLCLGIIFFSGSIYLLATNDLTAFDFTRIALVTPLGGTLLIIAWFILLLNFITLKKK